MKKITKVENVPKEVLKYVAEDGIEFDNEKECVNYERGLFRKQLDESGIETCDDLYGYPNCDGGENYESHNYYWFRPKNYDEIVLLCKAFEGLDDPSIASYIGDHLIGEWICLEADCEGDVVWVTTLGDGIDYAEKLLKKLGYDIVVSEVQNNE